MLETETIVAGPRNRDCLLCTITGEVSFDGKNKQQFDIRSLILYLVWCLYVDRLY